MYIFFQIEGVFGHHVSRKFYFVTVFTVFLQIRCFSQLAEAFGC